MGGGGEPGGNDQWKDKVRTGQLSLALVIPAGLSDALDRLISTEGPAALINPPNDERLTLDLLIDPALPQEIGLLVSTNIERIVQGIAVRQAMMSLAPPVQVPL